MHAAVLRDGNKPSSLPPSFSLLSPSLSLSLSLLSPSLSPFSLSPSLLPSLTAGAPRYWISKLGQGEGEMTSLMTCPSSDVIIQ